MLVLYQPSFTSGDISYYVSSCFYSEAVCARVDLSSISPYSLVALELTQHQCCMFDYMLHEKLCVLCTDSRDRLLVLAAEFTEGPTPVALC